MKFDFDRKRILDIAREAASRQGFVVYADFNRYLRELIDQEKLEPIKAGWCQWQIRAILLDQRNEPSDHYRYERVRNKAHFYPKSQVYGHTLHIPGME